MPKTHPGYPLEFRRRMVELVRAGRTPEDLSLEFKPSAQSIRSWVRQANSEQSHGVLLTADEREELYHLRRENSGLREDLSILVKASAWFAREAGSE